jgi:hypothetical protein
MRMFPSFLINDYGIIVLHTFINSIAYLYILTAVLQLVAVYVLCMLRSRGCYTCIMVITVKLPRVKHV